MREKKIERRERIVRLCLFIYLYTGIYVSCITIYIYYIIMEEGVLGIRALYMYFYVRIYGGWVRADIVKKKNSFFDYFDGKKYPCEL